MKGSAHLYLSIFVINESLKNTNIQEMPMMLYKPINACDSNRETPTPWNRGDILHISMTPAPNCWPKQDWSVKSGSPTKIERRKNWKIKLAPKCIVRMANLHILNKPNVQPRQASIELKLWGHCPRGLSISGMSVFRCRSHGLKRKMQIRKWNMISDFNFNFENFFKFHYMQE